MPQTTRARFDLRPGLLVAAALCCLLGGAPSSARGAVERRTLSLRLGETSVSVNVYERPGALVTFFAPHHDEMIAAETAREAVARRGGRLVEIVSRDAAGRPARRLRFRLGGGDYGVDPNRVFTKNGRGCGGLPPEAEAAVERFAGALLEVIFAGGGGRPREGERLVVAVHNNADSGAKAGRERALDLTAAAFAAGTSSGGRPAFREQAAGVYLSNREPDDDNFVLLSTPRLLGFFAERGFSVVVQKEAAALGGKKCSVDDGSLSVYSALRAIPYVCLEADAAGGARRQREMLEAVYELLAAQAAGALPNSSGDTLR
jgi:hypothetical protein